MSTTTNAPPVTETAYLPIAATTRIEDPSSEAGKAFHENLDILRAQKGYRLCRWGRKVEDQDMVMMLIDWDSVSHHQAFEASPAYKPFLDKFTPMLAGAPRIFHVEYEPFPPSKAFDSPVTELVTGLFSPSISTESQATVQENAAKFIKASEAAPERFNYAIGGWVVEEQESEKVEGGKAKAFMIAIGWPSIEAHMAFRETQVFKDNIWLLTKGVAGMDMHHVKVQT